MNDGRFCQCGVLTINNTGYNRDFKIAHYWRLGWLEAYTGGLGPGRQKGVKNFNFISGSKTEGGETKIVKD